MSYTKATREAPTYALRPRSSQELFVRLRPMLEEQLHEACELRPNAAASKRRWMRSSFQRALNESRIKTAVVKDRRPVAKLQVDFSLGRGEAEAIALTLSETAQVLGIDEKNGINACKLLGVAFTTALGRVGRLRAGLWPSV